MNTGTQLQGNPIFPAEKGLIFVNNNAVTKAKIKQKNIQQIRSYLHRN